MVETEPVTEPKFPGLTLGILLGAARLDEHTPDWMERIDWGRLDLRNAHQCILGQVFGSFLGGLRALGLSEIQAAEYGFDLYDHRRDDIVQFGALTRGWHTLREFRATTS